MVKLKGATLVETIVSLVIISTIMSMIFVIIPKISNPSFKVLMAKIQCEEIITQIEEEQNREYNSQIFNIGDFDFEVNYINDENYENIKWMLLNVYEDKQLIYKKRKLLIVHEI